MLLELHRPKSLKEYVGQEQAVQIAINFMNSWTERRPFARAMVIHGPPGTGKTTLARCLARDYKIPYVVQNMSLDRDVESLRELRSHAQTGHVGKATGIKLMVLDECDSLTATGWKQVEALIGESRNPILIVCNYYSNVPREIKQVITELTLPRPTLASLREVANRALAKDSDIDLSAGEVAELCARAPSYRALLHGLYTRGLLVEPRGNLDDKETLVAAIFAGKVTRDDIKGHEIQQIFPWVHDNTTDWDAVEMVDFMQARRRKVGREMHKYSMAFLRMCRGERVRFPWSLAQMARNKPQARARPGSPGRAPRTPTSADAKARVPTKTQPPLDSFF